MAGEQLWGSCATMAWTEPLYALAPLARPAGILVACSNGRQYSIDVLEALEEEG